MGRNIPKSFIVIAVLSRCGMLQILLKTLPLAYTYVSIYTTSILLRMGINRRISAIISEYLIENVSYSVGYIDFINNYIGLRIMTKSLFNFLLNIYKE